MVRNPFRPNVLWGEGGEFPDFICCENPNTVWLPSLYQRLVEHLRLIPKKRPSAGRTQMNPMVDLPHLLTVFTTNPFL